MEQELDLTGMTWYGALVAIIMLMLSYLDRNKKRFDRRGYTSSQLEVMIREAVLSERDRPIIRRRIVDNVGMEALAEEFALSVPQIKRIVYKGEDRLAQLAGQN